MDDDKDRIVAVGLLTLADLTLLGPTFARAYKVDEAPSFEDLLRVIDEADSKARERGRNKQERPVISA